jgi:hypothetical protein
MVLVVLDYLYNLSLNLDDLDYPDIPETPDSIGNLGNPDYLETPGRLLHLGHLVVLLGQPGPAGLVNRNNSQHMD